MNIVLTLETPAGPFVFTDAEVPEHIRHGGTQALSIDRMIGGRRIVRPMGPDEDDITFSGLFAYQGTARSDFLDSVRRRGDLCTLSWDNRRMQVIVAAYRPEYRKAYEIGYTITFAVVSNDTALLDSVPPVTPAQQLMIDNAQLACQTNCLGNSVLSGLAAAVGAALTALQGALQPIAGGLKSLTDTAGVDGDCMGQTANLILSATAAAAGPLGLLLASTQKMIASSEASIGTPSFGGIIPGNPAAVSVGTFTSNVNTIAQLPALYEIQSVAQRMQANLAITGAGTAKTVTVAGGTLYDVSAQQYGDVDRWSDIASANGITDPSLSGINTLTIPA